MRVFAGSLTAFYGGADRERVAKGVAAWRADLAATLAEHLTEPLTFADDGAVVCDFDVSVESWNAVRLLAAYAEHPDLEWPDVLPGELAQDPAWRRTSADDFAATRFPQVVIPRVWLPGDFDFTAKQPMPDGAEVVLGSLDGLYRQLRVVNGETLQVPEGGALEAARSAGFLDLAACGLRTLLLAARLARDEGVLILLG